MTAMMFGDTESNPCADFFSRCSSWVVPSISDPLIFWPPPSQLPKFDTEGNDIYQLYSGLANIQPLKNTITLPIALRVANQDIFDRSRINDLSVAALFLTNEAGEHVQLPNDAPDNDQKTKASPSLYLSTISLPTLTEINIAGLCDETAYDNLQNLINDELSVILDSNSLTTIEFHKVFIFVIVFFSCFLSKLIIIFFSSTFWIFAHEQCALL